MSMIVKQIHIFTVGSFSVKIQVKIHFFRRTKFSEDRYSIVS